jgi:hypothetical protein
LHNPQSMVPSIVSNWNGKGVIFKGSINRIGYLSGEIIAGTFEIENPQRIVLKQVYSNLFQHYSIHTGTRTEIICSTYIPSIVNIDDERMRDTFVLALPPAHLIPSYQFSGGLEYQVDTQIHYYLEFNIKAQGIFTDFDLRIPITIGTRSEFDWKPNENFYPCLRETIAPTQFHAQSAACAIL